MKKQIWEAAGVLFLAVVLMFAGYLAGVYKQSNITPLDVEAAKQKTIDSLETVRYKQLVDSLTFENKELTLRINSISAYNQKTKKEINATNKKINSLPDSIVQHYVDSLRRANGFN